MKLKKITPSQFQVSNWSGGKTTQITIDPPDAVYADRAFDFRLSSASVELEESTFTPLPDYDRIIAPVQGQLALYYNRSAKPVVLNEMEFSRFDGGWSTRSRGIVTDYNLMTRKGVCTGDAFSVTLIPSETVTLPQHPTVSDGRYVRLIWCVEGAVQITAADQMVDLAPREALQMEDNGAAEIRIQHKEGDLAKLMIATVCFLPQK